MNRIDWFFEDEGLLWQFNLQYFEWLYDETLSVGARLDTILDFCGNTQPGRTMHAYPASLRLMAWIWFALRHGAENLVVLRRLHQDADWLRRFPEYQLDGNHLFENGIALLAAGSFLKDSAIQEKGSRILTSAIARQLCSDGGHCEGSPMYHSLLLWRLLQCIQTVRICSPGFEGIGAMVNAASKMLGWLRAVTFSDGRWPAVNDSAEGIAPEPRTLFSAAAGLGIDVAESRLGDSGYRMIRQQSFELFIDVGGIMPDWQPGHAHADTGSFCLQVHGKPVFVDTGCSTYADAGIRGHQRGTAAHNTWIPGTRNSSDMWSRFRVGKRCRVTRVEEADSGIAVYYITADGIPLYREFSWTAHSITIRDRFPGNIKGAHIALQLHTSAKLEAGMIDDVIVLETESFQNIETITREIAGGFNVLLPAACFLLYPSAGATESIVRVRI